MRWKPGVAMVLENGVVKTRVRWAAGAAGDPAEQVGGGRISSGRGS